MFFIYLIYIYMNMYIYVYIYICVYVYVYFVVRVCPTSIGWRSASLGYPLRLASMSLLFGDVACYAQEEGPGEKQKTEFIQARQT